MSVVTLNRFCSVAQQKFTSTLFTTTPGPPQSYANALVKMNTKMNQIQIYHDPKQKGRFGWTAAVTTATVRQSL